MRSIIVTLLVLGSLLTGCAYNSYEELEAEYKITGDSTKLDRRDAQMESAEEFFLIKHACNESAQHIWFCDNIYNGGRLRDYRMRKMPTTIDGTIRRYQQERDDGCQCASNTSIT